jgi:hypothetical protein
MFQEILRLIGTAAEAATCASVRPKASDGSPAPGWQGKSLKSGPWSHIWDPTEGDGEESRRNVIVQRYVYPLRRCGRATVRQPLPVGFLHRECRL